MKKPKRLPARKQQVTSIDDLSDRKLMAQLRRLDPEQYGDDKPPAASSQPPAKPDPGRKEFVDRSLTEMLKDAGIERGQADVADQLLRAATGLSPIVAEQIFGQVDQFSSWEKKDSFVHTAALLKAWAPSDINEAMLVTQMIAVHTAMVETTRRSLLTDQTSEAIESCTRRAVALSRVFIQQTEMLAKLRGKSGQSKVIVEHVHVGEGGQAIVGAVAVTKTGEGEGDRSENLQ